jgi:hypothetical protein
MEILAFTASLLAGCNGNFGVILKVIADILIFELVLLALNSIV